MGRYNDNAPIGNTCPIINEVVSFIEGIDWDLTNEDEQDLSEKSKLALATLEKIREANSTLRDWGNNRHNDAEYWEQEYDRAMAINKDLESQISDLQDELYEVKQELNN